MDFTLGQDYLMIRDSVRDFAENTLKPGVVDRDEKEYFDKEMFYQMGQLGLTGLPFEEEWGGAGFEFSGLRYCC